MSNIVLKWLKLQVESAHARAPLHACHRAGSFKEPGLTSQSELYRTHTDYKRQKGTVHQITQTASRQIDLYRWQRSICTLSVQLYSDVTSVNSVFPSDKIIHNSDNFRIKCLSYSKKSTILFFLQFLFVNFFI